MSARTTPSWAGVPARGLLALAVLAYGLFPLLWILATSFKTEAELTATPITWWPRDASLSNYVQAFAEQPLLRFMGNSLGISALSTLLTLAVAVPAAYALARLPVRTRRIVLVTLVALAMCPPASLQVPLFELMRSLGLINTWAALILPYAVLSLPVCTMVLLAFFQALPRSIDQAALIDGCGHVGVLLRVVLPLSPAALFTAGTLAFVNAWDEFLFALVLNAAPQNRTLPVGIMLYQGEYTFPWPLISAALIVATLPLLILMAFYRERSFNTQASVKG